MKTNIIQYLQDVRSKHPDAVFLFRRVDVYTMIGKDAYIGRSVFGLPVEPCTIICGAAVETANFQVYELDTYLPKLIRAGFRVAICDLPNV